MKTKFSIIACAIAGAIFMGSLTGCQQSSSKLTSAVSDSASGSMLIAYIDVDSIMANYTLAIELNDAIVKKHANMKSKLDREVSTFQKDAETFQDKLQKGIFVTQQRAEEEQQRLLMRQREIEKLEADYSNQLAIEQQNMLARLQDNILAYVKKYNTPEVYKYVITRQLGGNVWYASESLDITQDIINGLNDEYAKEKK